MIKVGRSGKFVLRERRREMCFGFRRPGQAEEGNATVEMKRSVILRELQRICERLNSRLVVADLQILNAQAIQRRNESRMNRNGAFELLDRLVSMTSLNRLQRLVKEVKRGLRCIVSRDDPLRNRLVGF